MGTPQNDLTPEQRQAIYAEEKARMEVRQELKAEQRAAAAEQRRAYRRKKLPILLIAVALLVILAQLGKIVNPPTPPMPVTREEAVRLTPREAARRNMEYLKYECGKLRDQNRDTLTSEERQRLGVCNASGM
jgi:hypothetical protein